MNCRRQDAFAGKTTMTRRCADRDPLAAIGAGKAAGIHAFVALDKPEAAMINIKSRTL
jgi:hypothetical protein